MNIDALIRSLAVNKDRPICYLLGAGASISSGMPSAERCIWEWKRDIFITNNPMLSESVGEISLPGTKNRIQKWLDQRGQFPRPGSAEEYSFYANECYPTSDDRRMFFTPYVNQAKPHTGYLLLPLLAKSAHIRSIWTTNFDNLVSRTCSASNFSCIDIGIDSSERISRPHNTGELRVISLHGDYRYDELKNTEEELQTQEQNLRDGLKHEMEDHDLIVIGYSGRDSSLMDVLSEIYSKKGKSRLFWCGYGDIVSAPVEKLLQSAEQFGRTAVYVATDGFDDLIFRIALRQLEGESLVEAKSILADIKDFNIGTTKFSAPPLPITSLIKSNAYPLSCPTQILKVDVDFPEGIGRRKWIEDNLSADAGIFTVSSNYIFALSDSNYLSSALAGVIKSLPINVALSNEDIRANNSFQSLLRRALVQAAAKALDVDTDNFRSIWDKGYSNPTTHERVKYYVHKAVSFRLVHLNEKLHVVLIPEVVIKRIDGELADREVSKILKNAIYGYQHNDVFDNDLKYWTSRLKNIELPTYGDQSFIIGGIPLYAGLSQTGKKALPENLSRHAKQNGIVINDAELVFSDRFGKRETKNVNPLMGLTQNRPWDFSLTASGLSPSVHLSVICPKNDKSRLQIFLNKLQEKSFPLDKERDYLQDFQGFAGAFGLPLNYPDPSEPKWITLDDLVGGHALNAAIELAQRICKSLDQIRAIQSGTVAIIYVPSRWESYKVIKTETEHFNLHDYIKAYAARHGQSTQFIREETTLSQQVCRVKWWLSLAIYAKALRTPWRLDCLDDQTAFVGIGYGIDTSAANGKHILLGCSHLYNARGEGLQFRLGKIENPIIRRDNPFMSEDDARRTGHTIRQLFYDAKMQLPSRVVIHKRTEFTEEEKKGLTQGLEGVSNIELIEINMEESLRYLSSKLKDNQTQIDKFPVPRGSTVILDSRTALLWVHGSAPSANNPSFKYYQGKRRIPTPLLIRRHMGTSDIVQVATEILGLSKMNWNTFDYYSRLPCTLDSASSIAKVGRYLTGFNSAPYDYRLLI